MKIKEIAFLVIIVVLSGCRKDSSNSTLSEYAPSSVLVTLMPSYSIVNTFVFINSFDNDVEVISSKEYLSGLPADSLDYIKKYLCSRSYLNEGDECYCNCCLNEQNKISIAPRLFTMNDTVNQYDWTSCIEDLLLTEQLDTGSHGYFIHFHVPVGEEEKWIDQFKQYEFVESATLNYLFHN